MSQKKSSSVSTELDLHGPRGTAEMTEEDNTVKGGKEKQQGQ